MKHSQDKNKVKKKVGKMKVSCEKCGSGISNLTETRQQFRLKLRGFCESCNKFKVAYIVDHKAIAESGKRFDFIVKENLPATAQPLPPNSNTQAQKPASPTSTTTPPASSTTAPTASATQPAPASDPLHTAINSDTGKAFASMLKLTADQLHKVLTTTNTAPSSAPAQTSTTTPQASAAQGAQFPRK